MKYGEAIVAEVKSSQLLQRREGSWLDGPQLVAREVEFLKLMQLGERVVCHVAQSGDITSK
jgi:hypothetical protein